MVQIRYAEDAHGGGMLGRERMQSYTNLKNNTKEIKTKLNDPLTQIQSHELVPVEYEEWLAIPH